MRDAVNMHHDADAHEAIRLKATAAKNEHGKKNKQRAWSAATCTHQPKLTVLHSTSLFLISTSFWNRIEYYSDNKP